MSVDHALLVMLAKSFGLLCFVLASALVLYYALRPSARERYDRAKRSIIVDEDRPATTRGEASGSNGEAAGEDDEGAT